MGWESSQLKLPRAPSVASGTSRDGASRLPLDEGLPPHLTSVSSLLIYSHFPPPCPSTMLTTQTIGSQTAAKLSIKYVRVQVYFGG